MFTGTNGYYYNGTDIMHLYCAVIDKIMNIDVWEEEGGRTHDFVLKTLVK